MKKARAGATFPIPDELTDLIGQMETLESMNSFYRGGFTASDGSLGLVFIKSGMMKLLKKATHLLGDGTYEILPRNPRFAQLYIIHFRAFDTVSFNKFKFLLSSNFKYGNEDIH